MSEAGEQGTGDAGAAPDVSFLVACHNAGALLAPAVASALAQRGVAVEVVIVDDGSSDGSLERAHAMAAADPRVRVARTPVNGGPAAARNVALDLATGRWLAVLDSDDLLHPDRSAVLIAAAEADGADLVCDDLLEFRHAGESAGPTHAFLPPALRRPRRIDLHAYLSAAGPPLNASLGYLKPMFRRESLGDRRYDERLRVAEDDDLLLRLLLDGARWLLVPRPLYFYRKHGASISHRLSAANARRMADAARRMDPRMRAVGGAVRKAWVARRNANRRLIDFECWIEAIKTRDVWTVLRLPIVNPGILLKLRGPIAGALGKLRARVDAPVTEPDRGGDLIVLSSADEPTESALARLAPLASAAREAGRAARLLHVSPAATPDATAPSAFDAVATCTDEDETARAVFVATRGRGRGRNVLLDGAGARDLFAFLLLTDRRPGALDPALDVIDPDDAAAVPVKVGDWLREGAGGDETAAASGA